MPIPLLNLISQNLKNIATQENLALLQLPNIGPNPSPKTLLRPSNSPNLSVERPTIDEYGPNEGLSMGSPQPLFKSQIRPQSITEGIIIRKDLEKLLSTLFPTTYIGEEQPTIETPQPIETGGVFGSPEQKPIGIDIIGQEPQPLGADLTGIELPEKLETAPVETKSLIEKERRQQEEEKRLYDEWLNNLPQEERNKILYKQYKEMQRQPITSIPTAKGGEIFGTIKAKDIDTEFQELPANSGKQVEEMMKFVEGGGKLPPIVVSKGGSLMNGRHRLEAYKRLGIDDIPVTYAIKGKANADKALKEVGSGWKIGEVGMPEDYYYLEPSKLSPKETAKGGETPIADQMRKNFNEDYVKTGQVPIRAKLYDAMEGKNMANLSNLSEEQIDNYFKTHPHINYGDMDALKTLFFNDEVAMMSATRGEDGFKRMMETGSPKSRKAWGEAYKIAKEQFIVPDSKLSPTVAKGGEITPFQYQNKNQEQIIHAMKTDPEGTWDYGNTYRHILEGTGDIFRETSQKFPADSYIDEKVTRLNKYFARMEEQRKHFPETGIHPEDSIQYAKKHNPDKFKRMIELWKEQPVETQEQELARQLNIAMLEGDFDTAKKLIPQIKASRTKLSPKMDK